MGLKRLWRLAAEKVLTAVVYEVHGLPVYVELVELKPGVRGNYVFTSEDLESLRRFLEGSIYGEPRARLRRGWARVRVKLHKEDFKFLEHVASKVEPGRLRTALEAVMGRGLTLDGDWEAIQRFLEGRIYP